MANLRVNKITGTEVFETTGSVQFTGTTSALSVPAGTDFAYGTGAFTIECFIYAPTLAATPGAQYSDHIIYSQTVGGTNYLYLAYSPDGTLYWTNAITGGGTSVSTSSGVIVANKWQHVVACRDSNNIFRIFVDGSVVYSGYNNFDFNNTTYNPTIGNYTHIYSQLPFTGHISNVRVLKGTALYTKNFTPPTRELTVIPNTVLLCCQSTTRANEEKTGKTITVNGNAVANELTPGLLTDRVKSGGDSAISGSVEFDGNDYLSLADSTDFDIGLNNQPFTWELWFYKNSPNSVHHSLGLGRGGGLSGWNSTNGHQYIGFQYTDGALYWQFWSGSGLVSIQSSTTAVSIGSWHHYAISYDGTTTRAFLNGVLFGSSTSNYGKPSASNITRIGAGPEGTFYSQTFQSNVRVIKGNALYTSNFIPPTRELKRLPGTVLLCCKNSSDPTAEETGKTITPFGSLVYNPPELVNDGAFNSASSWPSAQADWSISGGKATINSANSGYDYLGILTNRATNGLLYELRFDISSWTAGRLELAQSDSSNIGVTVSGNGPYAFRFRYTGTTNGNISLYSYTDTTASFTLDNLSLKQVASVPSPPFTPSVGSDGSVTFDGVTKINTPNYFYLPTGNTEDRGRGRGVFGGGTTGPNINVIQYINVQSSGNAIDFGDLTIARRGLASCSSSTRGVFGGGTGGTPDTFRSTIDYITISTTGNAQSFGNLTDSLRQKTALSNSTRGVFAGGYNPLFSNIIEYITISSTGNAQDFGDLSAPNRAMLSCSSSTRGCFAGSAPSNVIEYITINSTGNTSDFGDLTVARGYSGGCSNPTRGVFGGGAGPAGQVNVIDYITISSTGNAQDFGDLTAAKADSNSCSSSNRGFFAGGYTPTVLNTIEFITISSTGNAQDFGDLLLSITQLAACSDSHGGLG